MSIEMRMPALSPTMEKGTLAKWLVGVGDVVKSGDLLAEIETDKATMEFEAVEEGTIASILIAEGTDDVPVGTVIATLAEAGDAGTLAQSTRKHTPAAVPDALAAETAVPVQNQAPAAVAPAPNTPVAVDDTTNATPLARRIAAAKGIALAFVTGSGPNGRIVKADLGFTPCVIAARPPAELTVAVRAAKVYEAPIDIPHSVIKLSGMRKTIARRLTESKQTVPHFYLSAHCNIDALLTLRSSLNDSLAARGIKLSVNDLVIKAMALAMIHQPDVNVQFAGDDMYRFDRVDISMAVAIDGGLITPVIRDVGSLALSSIAEQSKSLAAGARDGKLVPADYQGGTASISNLGMFNIDEMFPVINPPQALIVGIGAGSEKPWKIHGGIALATILTATASFDHRVIDGVSAARFMATFRDLIESPMQLLC